MQNLITDNPIVRREARLRFWREWSRRTKLAAIAAAMIAAAALALATRGLIGAAGLAERATLIMVYAVLLALGAAVVGARSVAGEREVRTWEQMLITRLQPVHLVVGKVTGVLWPIIGVLVVTAPGLWIWLLHSDRITGGSWSVFLPAVLFSPVGFGDIGGGGMDTGLFWVFTAGLLWVIQGAALGVFASLRYRSTVSAGVLTFVLLAVVLILNLSMLLVGGHGLVESPWLIYLVRYALVPSGVILILAAGLGLAARRRLANPGAAAAARKALAPLALLFALELCLKWIHSGAVGGDYMALGPARLMVVSVIVAWGWPIAVILIALGLATYEFREFDRWIQAGQTAAGR
ncbi:MAG: hypothetical protein JSV65_18545 [Armatimonadota bacterium]|nr:MAG: hypothetical protein JSV65_18545 [Armatimonadota bacterium]